MDLKKDTQVSQDPDDVLDYVFDWYDSGNGFLGSTDTISSVTYSYTSGVTLSNTSNDTHTATFWLSGGTAGQLYTVTCRVITAAGRSKDASVDFLIEEN